MELIKQEVRSKMYLGLFLLVQMFIFNSLNCDILAADDSSQKIIKAKKEVIEDVKFYCTCVNNLESELILPKLKYKKGENLELYSRITNNKNQAILINTHPFLLVINGGNLSDKKVFIDINKRFIKNRRENVLNFIYLKSKKCKRYFEYFDALFSVNVFDFNSLYPFGVMLKHDEKIMQRLVFNYEDILKRFLLEGDWELVIVQGYKLYSEDSSNTETSKELEKQNIHDIIEPKIIPICDWRMDKYQGVNFLADKCIILSAEFSFKNGEIVFENHCNSTSITQNE